MRILSEDSDILRLKKINKNWLSSSGYDEKDYENSKGKTEFKLFYRIWTSRGAKKTEKS